MSILDKKIIKLEKNNYSEKNIINNLNIKPDLIISLNFLFKISQDILRLSKFGGINLHLGLLPECKGLFPVTRSILNKIELGFTIHEMNNRIDEGRILKKEKINYKISNKIEYDKIYNILFKRSYYAILDTLRKINKNEKFIKITNTKNKNYFSHFTTKELLLLFLDKFKL